MNQIQPIIEPIANLKKSILGYYNNNITTTWILDYTDINKITNYLNLIFSFHNFFFLT